MKKVLLVTSLGAALMLGACSSKEESMDNISPETNTESAAESVMASEQKESSNAGWIAGGDYYDTKTIEEQVIVDNDIMKLTLTGNLEADERNVYIEYILENKTDSELGCFLDHTEMGGWMMEIKGSPDVDANTKITDEFTLEREYLIEDNLNKLSTVKGEIAIFLDTDRLNNIPIRFNLK